MFKDIDALLTKEFGVDKFDFEYIDISTPDILEYMEDINTIVESRLPLPYISISTKPVVWGSESVTEMFEKIKEHL